VRAAAAAALLVLLNGGGARASQPLNLQYDVRYGPLRLVTLRTSIVLDAGRYRATSEMETVGIVGTVFPWKSEAMSEGLRREASLVPERHHSKGIYRGQSRTVDLEYGDSGAVLSRVDPKPENDWRDGVPAEMQQTTIDPLTAGLAVMASNCSGRLPVFDGRRRYDLELTDLGEAEVESSSYHLYSGGARRCRAEVKALGGFWREDPRHSEKPTTLDYWIAPPRGDLPPLPVYLEINGQRGTLSIHLTAIEGSEPQG
jgi:hypothetical protein